jgi:predicted secreted protein
MLVNQANERDEALNLSEEQDFAATDVGKNAGGTAIQLDVSNFKDQTLMVNARYKNDATADYAITIESSSDAFTTTKLEKSIPLAPGAAHTEFQLLEPFAIAPSNNKIRLRMVKTAGSVTDVDMWVSPITP